MSVMHAIPIQKMKACFADHTDDKLPILVETHSKLKSSRTNYEIEPVIGNLMIGLIIDLVSRMFSANDGVASDIVGLKAGYGFIASLALLCSVCSFILYIILKKRNQLVRNIK